MPKASEQLANARREEIINACEHLYETMSFKEITIKEIGAVTSFTRTSIYNYFQTKEEIFLALLQREYAYWTESINEIILSQEALTREELADKLAHSIDKRKNMLRLMSMNLYDIEENSSLESLVEFKRVYGKSVYAVKNCLKKFCADMSEKDIIEFIYEFFPFIYGIYPYAFATNKQKKAMEIADIEYVYMSVYEIAFNGINKMLLRKRDIECQKN